MEKGRLILLVAASACMGSMIATAQTTKVTGKVISLEDNMPVRGYGYSKRDNDRYRNRF